MRLDVAYEMVDFRPDKGMERICLLDPVPNGMRIWTQKYFPQFLEWNDNDDEAFIDDEENGRISILTRNGRIEFVRLSLENWRDLEPFYEETPDFETDKEVNDYFVSLITTDMG